jgi:hypothetical protein
LNRLDFYRQKAQQLHELALSTRDQQAAAALQRLATSYQYLARQMATEPEAPETPAGAA